MTVATEIVLIEGRIAPAAHGLAKDIGLRDARGGFVEVFGDGAFRPAQAAGAPLLFDHDPERSAGAVVRVNRRDDGWWWATARLDATPVGQALLSALERGDSLSLSPAFRDLVPPRNLGGLPELLERVAVNLGEVSIMPTEEAAYRYHTRARVASRTPRQTRDAVLAEVARLRSASGLPGSAGGRRPRSPLNYTAPTFERVEVR